MTPAQQLHNLLLAHDWTIAVAESLTAGHIQSLIASVSGSSRVFLGGVTCYTIDQKVDFLHVDRDHAASVNCVSEEVASQMAAGVRTRFGSAVSIATTGYAEAWGDVSTPHAHIVVDIQGDQTHQLFRGPDLDRVTMQRAVATAAVDLIVARISALSTTDEDAP